MTFKIKKSTQIIAIFLCSIFFLSNCSTFKKTNAKETPTNALERARKNVTEGRGVSLKNVFGGNSTNYEFSSSNSMWRATLEILDFLPLTVVDYSGGVIVTDWYNENNSTDFLKISVRFTSNEIRSDSLKIIVHKKNCRDNLNCSTSQIKSKINEELMTSIIKKAAFLEQEKNKKK